MGFVPVVDDEGVLVRTSRRLSTTTTLVLGRHGDAGRGALLVDPAWEADELAAIAAEVRARGARVAAGFATHAHHDHLLWHPRLGPDVPRWATPRAAEVAASSRGRLRAEARADARRYGGTPCPPEVLDLIGRVAPVPAGAPGVPDPEGVLPPTEIVMHDGHAPGHGAVWLPRSRVLVAGDMLSDVELPLPCDEITGPSTGAGGGAARDVATYLDGLERLAPYVARCAALVPGHGSPTTEPGARLDADRRYLDAVLAGRRSDDPRLARPGASGEDRRLRDAVRG